MTATEKGPEALDNLVDQIVLERLTIKDELVKKVQLLLLWSLADVWSPDAKLDEFFHL